MSRRHRVTMPNWQTIVVIVVVAVMCGFYLKWTAEPAPEGPGVEIARQAGATGHPGSPTGQPDSAPEPKTTSADEPAEPTSTTATPTETDTRQTVMPTPDSQVVAAAKTHGFTGRTPGEPRGRLFVADSVGHTVIYPVNPGGDLLAQKPSAAGEDPPPATTETTSSVPTAEPGSGKTPAVEATARPAHTPAVVPVEWQRLRPATVTSAAVDIALSDTNGPATVSNGVLTGFAHTPTGAAIAAWTIYQSVVRGGPLATRAVIEYVTDPELVATAEQMAASEDGNQWPVGESLGTTRGFTVTDYTGDRARIKYAIPAAGTYRAVELSVVWVDGTWKMVSPKQGKFSIITAAEEAGYSQW